jgi:steroid delta-isomerase-like uncharacterized protein
MASSWPAAAVMSRSARFRLASLRSPRRAARSTWICETGDPGGVKDGATVDVPGQVLATWIGLWNQHALDRFSEAVSSRYVHHAMTGRDLDLEGFRGGFRAIVDAFPDVHYRIEHTVTGQDVAAAYLVSTATHRGPFFGIPPSGQTVTFRGMYHCRIVNGRIDEDWDVFDLLNPILQLGGQVRPPD